MEVCGMGHTSQGGRLVSCGEYQWKLFGASCNKDIVRGPIFNDL